MEGRIRQLEERVEALGRAVERLQAQLDGRAATTPAPEILGGAALTPLPPIELEVSGTGTVLSLVGRSLLILAGAFVFRALTAGAMIPGWLGVMLGMLFAGLWIGFAAREAGRANALSAAFYAGAAALIGFPLLVETASRLAVLPAPLAAFGLTAFTTVLLALAARYRLQTVAWQATLGCVIAALALIRASAAPLPYLLVLFLLAAATLGLDRARQWSLLRWPVALVLDAVMVRQFFSVAAAEGVGSAALLPVLIALHALVLLYLGALLTRTWRWKEPVRWFEGVQTALVLGVAFATLTRAQADAGALGALVAAAALGTAARLGAQRERALDAWFYGVLGVVLVLASGPLLLSGVWLALAWAALALVLVVLGRWRSSAMFWGSAASLGWAAAAASGALGMLWAGLAGAPGAEASLPAGAAMAVVPLSLALWAAMSVRVSDGEVGLRAVALAVLGLGVLAAAAAVTLGARHLLGGTPAQAILLRTLLLNLAAIGLAFGRRSRGPVELGWAAGALLALSALKLLVQDLPQGDPLLLVIAFLALGAGILLVPRLLKLAPEKPKPAG